MLLTETASSARDSLAAPLRRLSTRIFGGRWLEASLTEAASFYGQRGGREGEKSNVYCDDPA